MTILLRKAYLVKVPTKGGDFQKYDHVVCGCPQILSDCVDVFKIISFKNLFNNF